MLCECKNYSGSLQIGDLLTGIENKDGIGGNYMLCECKN